MGQGPSFQTPEPRRKNKKRKALRGLAAVARNKLKKKTKVRLVVADGNALTTLGGDTECHTPDLCTPPARTGTEQSLVLSGEYPVHSF